MKKFFILYLMPAAAMEKMMASTTPEEQKAGMDKWVEWMKNHREVLADVGAPLGKTKRVTSQGVADAKNEILGYSIVEAESHEAAAQLFADSPHLEMTGATIDVMTIGSVPGM